LALGRWRDASTCAESIDAPIAKWRSCRAQILERSARLAAEDATLDADSRTNESARLRALALDELERAVAMGRTDWSELDDPTEWASLREDPRFRALVDSENSPR
jgi:hypothetical protein